MVWGKLKGTLLHELVLVTHCKCWCFRALRIKQTLADFAVVSFLMRGVHNMSSVFELVLLEGLHQCHICLSRRCVQKAAVAEFSLTHKLSPSMSCVTHVPPNVYSTPEIVMAPVSSSGRAEKSRDVCRMFDDLEAVTSPEAMLAWCSRSSPKTDPPFTDWGIVVKHNTYWIMGCRCGSGSLGLEVSLLTGCR